MQSPTWLERAWSELGITEAQGSTANPRIVALFRDAHHPSVTSDETAWCAAFVGAILERSGIESTRSLMARSYLAWGEPADEARPGAIAVFSRGGDPALGHVGFVLAALPDAIILLGGNQKNAVTVERMPRTKLLGLRWPVEKAANDIFEKALAHVLEMEGGYDNDPHDPGGPTNFGITLAAFAAWKGEPITPANRGALIEALKSIDRTAVREIYLKRYWRVAKCPDLPPALAFFHFDAAVNHGAGAAARMLQEAAGAEIDGDIGPLTLAAARSAGAAKVLVTYAGLRRARYRALPHFWRFGRGWLKRVDTALTRARAYLSSSPSEKGTSPMTTTTQSTEAKWWGQSLTIWGAITTALSAILPPLASAAGLDISSDQVTETGTDLVGLAQAVTALLGTIATIYGRLRATTPLARRAITFKL